MGEVTLRRLQWTVLGPLSQTQAEARRYDPTDQKYLQSNRCFLCGIALDQSNATEEHVFPKWLLNKYDLWDGALSLLNGSVIRYRQIRIPCCRTCNGVHLSALEGRLERAVNDGYKAFRLLPRGVLFQWVLKIFFEILYLEMRLAADVRNPSGGTILTAQFLEDYRLEHALLNSVRLPVRVAKPLPWSIFVLPAQVSSKDQRNFDFVDNLHGQVIAVRMSEVAVFAVLLDNQTQEGMFRRWFARVADRVRLHPIQFREIAAKVVYKRQTMTLTPRFMNSMA